jgi:hypothetical protein
MSAFLKWVTLGAALWYGALTVYDLPMRKLELAIAKPTRQTAG